MEGLSETKSPPEMKSRAEYMRNYYATHPEFRKKKYENQKETLCLQNHSHRNL